MKLFTLFLLTFPIFVNASITEGGRGMLFGGDHAFAVTATNGWVLDNKSGVKQGIHMLFYPKGMSWSNSPVVVYGKAISTLGTKNIEENVENTVNDFRNNGNPEYVAANQGILELPTGKEVKLYYYSGDKWGNYEAVAYILEEDTINFLVFNSRTKENFEKYIDVFKETVMSYKNLYQASSNISQTKFSKMLKESNVDLGEVGGKEYETSAIKMNGQFISHSMRDCTSYLTDKDMNGFQYLVKIGNAGKIIDSLVSPTSALSACFSGLMSGVLYPSHDFDSFVFNLNMKVNP